MAKNVIVIPRAHEMKNRAPVRARMERGGGAQSLAEMVCEHQAGYAA